MKPGVVALREGSLLAVSTSAEAKRMVLLLRLRGSAHLGRAEHEC